MPLREMIAMSANEPVILTVAADPHLARLVRMTASNVAMLSSMSVDRVEDIRMVAEEAFVYACSSYPGSAFDIVFEYDSSHVSMTFDLGEAAFAAPTADDPTAAYADLILTAVCDSYEKREDSNALVLTLKADVA